MAVGINSTDEVILEEMQRIRVLYKLKHTMRYQSVRDHDVHSESVAEHIYAMFALANYFLPLDDPHGTLDRLRVYELMLYHELGEVETGDIVFHRKSESDKLREQEAARRVIQMLPESTRRIAQDRFDEFEACSTPEAKFADAIDKLEPIFEMFEEEVLPAFRRLGITRSMAVDKKRIAAKPYPHLSRFLDAWERRAVALDIFPS
jgi:putative hydrolases of HD superfamily